MSIHTKSEFFKQFSKNAIVVPLHSDLVAVINRCRYNDVPCIEITTARNGDLSKCENEIMLADGDCLDANPEGWSIVLKEAIDNLETLLKALKAHRDGKTPDKFADEYFGTDED